jgi:ribosomal protein S18 acetylase RimI-like enzyme
MDDAWLVDAAAWAAVQPYQPAPGVVVADTDGLRWYRTPIDYEGLNGVLSAQLAEDGLDEAVEQALTPFREAGLPMLWHVGPTSTPPSLPQALACAGLALHEAEPGMVADLTALGAGPPAPDGLEVRRVADEDELADWCRVWVGTPPDADMDGLVALRGPGALGPDAPKPHLLARLGGAPVACAAVLVGDRRSGPPPAAWVEDVVTAATVRRRGIGAAVTHACLTLARSRGLARAALTASPDGHAVYRRLGFLDRCTVTRYRASAPAPARSRGTVGGRP